MPDERLAFTQGVMERLRAAHAGKSQEELLELVCQLTKTYVLEQTIPFDVPLPEREAEVASSSRRPDLPDVPEPSEEERPRGEETEPAWRQFARLMEGIKRRTGLPQLEGLSIQPDGRAVLMVDNQKITFGERVTVEFVPRSGMGPAPRAEAPPAPPAAQAPPPSRPFEAPRAGRPAPGRPAPGRPAPGRPAPGRPAPGPQAPAAPAARGEEPQAKPLDDVDHVVERFRGLELE